MSDLARFRPGLEKALALVGTHAVEDVVKRVVEGNAQIWTENEALIITEVLEYPQKKALRFWIATGELEDCINLSRQVLEWGRGEGCEIALLTGRRGWTKALRDEGWADRMIVLTKEL